jgi:hypothetical protein
MPTKTIAKKVFRWRTHWCTEGKHRICGGRVYNVASATNSHVTDLVGVMKSIELGSICKCDCHNINEESNGTI